jgi:hypothetical protein
MANDCPRAMSKTPIALGAVCGFYALRLSAILLLVVFLAGCGAVTKKITPLAVAGDSAPHADDIREAVFRYLIARCNTSYYKVCFLSIERRGSGDTAKLQTEDSDPSDEFLRRFTDLSIPVKRESDCTGGTRGVFDKKTNAQGLIFNVGKITQHSATSAEIEGGYYAAGLSASGNTYTVEKKNGKWIVTKDVMHWISQFTNPSQHRRIAAEQNPLQTQVDALQNLQTKPPPNSTRSCHRFWTKLSKENCE